MDEILVFIHETIDELIGHGLDGFMLLWVGQPRNCRGWSGDGQRTPYQHQSPWYDSGASAPSCLDKYENDKDDKVAQEDNNI